MKHHSPGKRESLLRCLLEKAEGEGGEEWLLRCLEEGQDSAPPVRVAITPPNEEEETARVRSGTRQQPVRKKKRLKTNASPQLRGGERAGSSVRKSAPGMRQSSATQSAPVAPSSGHPASNIGGETCSDSNVSELSMLVTSLSNVLQQFKGAQSIGAKVKELEGAQVTGSQSINNKYSDDTGAHFHGANENFHSANYMADIGSVWQSLSESALQEEVADNGLLPHFTPF